MLEEILSRQVCRANARAAAKSPPSATQPAYMLLVAELHKLGDALPQVARQRALVRMLTMNRPAVRRAFFIARRRQWTGSELLLDLAAPRSRALTSPAAGRR